MSVVITTITKSCFLQKFLLETFALSLLHQGIALIEAIAQLEFTDDVVAETALAEIGQADALPIDMVVKEILEVVVGKVVHHKHTLALVLSLFLLIAQLAFFHLDVILVGQPLQRLVVVELLVLHDEVHHVSSLSAGETFAQTLGRRHHKRRCLLVMERAQPFIVHPRPLQRDELRHHIHNLCRVQYPVYGSLVNHTGAKVLLFFLKNKLLTEIKAPMNFSA